jgi:hypothetical protein
MRVLRLIIALGMFGFFCLLVSGAAQAASPGSSAACRRYDIMMSAKHLGIKVPDWAVPLARRHCNDGIKAADVVPLRTSYGEMKDPRPDNPCRATSAAQQQAWNAPATQHLEAECIADWVEHITYQRDVAKPGSPRFSLWQQVLGGGFVVLIVCIVIWWSGIIGGIGPSSTGGTWSPRG